MKSQILLFTMLLVCAYISAQDDDVSIHVRKKAKLAIEPDSMFFKSVTSRRFKIRNVPDGYIIKADFLGHNCYVQDSNIILQPWFMYSDSDVIKEKDRYSQLTADERTTPGEYYITQVHIRIFDKNGIQTDSLIRNCYIKPDRWNH